MKSTQQAAGFRGRRRGRSVLAACLPARNFASACTPPMRPTEAQLGAYVAPEPDRLAVEGRRAAGSASSHRAPVNDRLFSVHVADDASATAPFFTRPSIEQPYYDIANQAWRDRSFAP